MFKGWKSNIKRLLRKQDTHLQQAMSNAAYAIRDRAIQLVPVDTGYLRSTIEVELYDNGRKARVTVRAHYAIYVELGTRFMAPQPFLGPATDEILQKFPHYLKDMFKL